MDSCKNIYSSFYLAYDELNTDHIKLGITTRLLGHRRKDYNTFGPVEYYAVARFNCDINELLNIEKKCLEATNKWLPNPYKHIKNAEWRVGDRYEIWNICKKQFPEKYEIVDPSEYNTIKDNYDINMTEIQSKDKLKKSLIPSLCGFQIEAYSQIQKIISEDNKTRKINLEVFCGGGKTIIYQKIFWDYADYFDCFILIVPYISLMANMQDRWKKIISTKSWNSLYISSAKFAIADKEKIRSMVLKSDKLFICITKNSFEKLKYIFELKKYKKYMLVGDEAHHLCDPNNSLQWLEKTGYDKLITKSLFATSTPKIGNYKHLQENCIVWNNSNYFGNTIQLTPPANLRRLLDEKFLCRYKIIMGSIKSEYKFDVQDKIDNRELIDQQLNYQAACKFLKSLLLSPEIKMKKILMYTNRIETGVRQLTKLCNKEFENFIDINGKKINVGIFSADSQQSQKHNKNAKIGFESNNYDITILINCRLYNEGINIPTLDSVVFCDPKQSTAEIIQIFGRPLRNPNFPESTEKIAYVVIPFVDNIKYSDGLRYEKLIKIISIIATQDEFLRTELQKKKMGKINISGNSLLHIASIDYKDNNICPVKFDTNFKFIDVLNEQINKKCNSMKASILYILRDYIPRTVEQIWYEIKSSEIYKSSQIECIECCESLFNAGEILCMSSKYYIKKIIRMTLDEFIADLTNRNIKTESDYRRVFRGKYTKDYHPTYPIEIYKEFNWNMLTADEKYYSLEECKKRIKELESIFWKIWKLDYGITSLDKNKLLNTLDKKIPSDVEAVYKKKLYEINETIFPNLDNDRR